MRALSIAFLFNEPSTTDFSTLSLHDALPISRIWYGRRTGSMALRLSLMGLGAAADVKAYDGGSLLGTAHRSEEHTSELQSRPHLVCRLLLEKKNEDDPM